jgi:hypothetical protein
MHSLYNEEAFHFFLPLSLIEPVRLRESSDYLKRETMAVKSIHRYNSYWHLAFFTVKLTSNEINSGCTLGAGLIKPNCISIKLTGPSQDRDTTFLQQKDQNSV